MKTVVIAIAGGSGSGKTTIARKLVEEFNGNEIQILKLDDYYKFQNIPFEERIKTNYDHPDSLDFDLFIKHVKSLTNNEKIDKPIYDFGIHNRTLETERIEPSKILILEGILVLEDERIRNLSDIKVYVDTDSDVRFIRRLVRDINERKRTMESVISQYLKTVKPMHEEFVERTKKYADIIIPNELNHDVAVSLLKAKVAEILKNEK